MTRPARRDSALVLGGGYAGLLAARVLADHFRHVTVIERDPPPDAGTKAATRPGVPQAHHPHALLARGAQHLEELFPGLRAELVARGCPVEDFAAATRILFPTGWAPRQAVGFDVQLMARTILEHALRERVTALPAVTFRYGLQADQLLLDRDGIGVGIRPRRSAPSDDDEQVLHADLLVDATGRGTHLPQWLAQAGHRLPEPLLVDGKVTYASRLYTLEPGPDQDWFASYQPTLAPHSPRGAVAARISPNQWQLALIGTAGHTPPRDDDGFRAFAAALPNPDFAHIIDHGAPAGPIHRTHATANRWHRYHRLRTWPGRLIALGDSVCALNPVYGQGMTVAAQQSHLLNTLLNRHAGRTGIGRESPVSQLDRLGPRFQRAAAAIARGPWLLNTSADRAWQDTTAPLSTRLATAYLAALTARIPHHPGLFLRFARTMHMLDAPATLASPRALAQLASLPTVPRRHGSG